MSLKQQIYEHCRRLIDERLEGYQRTLDELIHSAANETKSTAGDKFETGRAMLHIEQDNTRRQLAEALAQKAVIDKINPKVRPEHVGLGSLVRTGDVDYFLSTALGKMVVDGRHVIALSVQSPLGSLLQGRHAGDKLTMGGREIEILEVL